MLRDIAQAMEALQTSLPDIVFLDLVMPKIDGDRVFQYIRTHPRTCHIPIVIVSGTLVEDARDALNMKADGYVAKSRREDLERNILTVLKRLETGEAEARREILGLEHLIPRHKVKELLAVRRFSQTVLRTIVEGIAEVDGRQRVLFVNRACLEMVDRPELDLIGIQVADLLTAEHRATLEATIAAFLSASEGSSEPVALRYRGRVLRKQKGPLPLEARPERVRGSLPPRARALVRVRTGPLEQGPDRSSAARLAAETRPQRQASLNWLRRLRERRWRRVFQRFWVLISLGSFRLGLST